MYHTTLQTTVVLTAIHVARSDGWLNKVVAPTVLEWRYSVEPECTTGNVHNHKGLMTL